MNIIFVGWNTKNGADKVWVAIQLAQLEDNKSWPYSQYAYLTVWGKRGKKLKYKIVEDYVPSNLLSEVGMLISHKILKGYHPIKHNRLNTVYPEFQQDLEKIVFWNSLKI